ncbi:TonB-dependent receptor plug domain-containing protein [Aureibaculum luteum]|uniref:TonB-dependent receptor plug domain-containing protein n=1 Tax=Aureibaculum luteum TaxID=1548456 RepID=UPI000E47C428|nr:TonB-dependent receptor plug domain-containing protein [Aureibaculum luteum]
MKNSYVTFAIILILTFISFKSEGQEKRIKGFVTTFDSIPLINAKIIVSSSKLIFLTDSIGHFELNCLPTDRLKISANGFSTQKVKIKEENKMLHVNLKLKTSLKKDKISVAYGYVKDDKKLFSIASISDDDDDDFAQYADIYALIVRKLVGVQIINKEIIIRGPSSINGSNAALIIVDDVPVNIQTLEGLRPFNVKRISLLKDGSAAIYGSRGANGVVIIEMKKGGE